MTNNPVISNLKNHTRFLVDSIIKYTNLTLIYNSVFDITSVH